MYIDVGCSGKVPSGSTSTLSMVEDYMPKVIRECGGDDSLKRDRASTPRPSETRNGADGPPRT